MFISYMHLPDEPLKPFGPENLLTDVKKNQFKNGIFPRTVCPSRSALVIMGHAESTIKSETYKRSHHASKLTASSVPIPSFHGTPS